MQKNNNRLMQKVCSVIIVLAMAFNNVGMVFAQEAASPESLPSSTASSDSTQTATPESTPSKEPSSDGTTSEPSSDTANSDTASSDTASSTPSSEASSDTASSDATSEPSSDSTPSSEPTSEPNSDSSNSESVSEPVFEELKIDSFTQEAEMLENGQAQVSVGLSRDDVSVNYQWQSLAQEKEQKTPELLFDYSSYSDKSYYFPYADITEEELLAQNPGATWAGIEMYFDMKDKAKRQRSNLPIKIENGTPNYILEQIENGGAALADEAPAEWQNIENAVENSYAFEVTEDNADALYRCVITITDEEYLQQAAENQTDAYGAEAMLMAESTEASTKGIALPVEKEIITDNASVTIPQPIAMAAPAAAGVENVKFENGWIIGLSDDMEYITADTVDKVTEAKNAKSEYWTHLLGGRRKDNSLYLAAALTPDKKLPVLSAWYGKTVYFRVYGQGFEAAKAVQIPAYTDIDYITSEKQLYKDAVSVLNIRVPETNYDFYYSILSGTRNKDTLGLNDVSSSVVTTGVSLTPNKYTNADAGKSFNENADAFLRDAEGNYRYDSVIVGTAVADEPDLSGAAAWALRDYIAEGYGFITGHDMMYAYGGVNPNPNYVPSKTDTRTPYYKYNTRIDGHWNMNWLMGVNKEYKNASPYEAPTMVLSAGDYTSKDQLYGDKDGVTQSRLQIKTYTGAPTENVKTRTPTNYPYNQNAVGVGFDKGLTFDSHSTHSNNQIAYGTIWVDFVTNSLGTIGSGKLVEDKRSDSLQGTNNFYLTTNGNLALNQIGHIVQAGDVAGNPTVYYDEARILANTIMFVSQRQQCQVCQSEQGGNKAPHFVHRIYTAEELAKIGTLENQTEYPADGCYMLAANIELTDNWAPIENFRGHFSADNYDSISGQLTNHRITLGANGQPVFANDKGALGEYSQAAGSGWNLGTSPEQGINSIESADEQRTTGIARVSGYLSAFMKIDDTSDAWTNYLVAIKGTDGNEYWASVNSDSKYVIANLPCTGVMEARVYKANTYANDMWDSGARVVTDKKLRVNVLPEFWNTNETTAIYEITMEALPIKDITVYDGQSALFEARLNHSEKPAKTEWFIQSKNTDTWVPIKDSGLKYEITEPVFSDDINNQFTTAVLTIKDACVINSELKVKAVFTTKENDVLDTSTCSGAKPLFYGMLTVLPWPINITSPENVSVWADATATFKASVEAKDGVDNGLSVQWQIRKYSVDEWVNVEDYAPLNDGITRVEKQSSAKQATGNIEKPYKTESILKIINTPQAIDSMYVRAVYTYKGGHTSHDGHSAESEDTAAQITVKQPKLGVKWVDGQETRKGMSFENPLMCATGTEYSQETAVYEADVIYLPGKDETSEGTPTSEVLWKYKTTQDAQSLLWSQESANKLAQKLGVAAPRVTFETGTAIKQADGTYKIHTKMTISNVHWKFYSNDCFVSFSAQAINHYKTSPYESVTAENIRMPLIIDYKVGIKWNAGSQANNGDYTTWTYPNATVNAASRIKTLLFEFDVTEGRAVDKRNEIIANGAPSGMNVSFAGQQYLLFTSETGVSQQEIERFIRNNLSVKVYDKEAKPLLWVYINCEKNLASARAAFQMPISLSEQLASLRYEQGLNIAWSANHFFVGGSAVAHASRTDAGYYQWEINTGSGWRALTNENNPTLAIGNLNGNMNGYKYRVKYGDREVDLAMKVSNEISLSFGFTDIPVSGESTVIGYGTNYYIEGNKINIPDHLKSYVTSISFDWVGSVDRVNEGDVFFKVDSSDGAMLNVQHFGSGTSGNVRYTIKGGKGLEYIQAIVVNNARAVAYTATLKITNIKVSGVGSFEPGSGIVIQRKPHDAWDVTTVWHEQQEAPKTNIAAAITAQTKIYNGKETIAQVSMTDKNGALSDAQLEEIKARGTIEYSSGKTTSGNAKEGSGCIDVGKYTAQFVPAEQDEWMFALNSQDDIKARTVQFAITARPLHLYSYGNSKMYDKTDLILVENVKLKPFSEEKEEGVVPSDEPNVEVKPKSFMGTFSGVYNQTNGKDIKITRLSTTEIALEGARAHNYRIESEDYTGKIMPQEVRVHSLYQDAADVGNNPRNIKQYDGTKDAVINKIILEGVVEGDNVLLSSKTLKGQYKTANAGERLNSDGSVLADRFNNLAEVEITRTSPLELINNELGNYVIISEEYSGAIYRRFINAAVKDKEMIYGQSTMPAFKAADVYTNAETGQEKFDLVVDAMVADDRLEISPEKSKFVFNTEITAATPAGIYSAKYEGLNEQNYPVLSNYIIMQRDGAVVVSHAELIIAVDGGYEKYYGDENPTFDVIFKGFVNGDTALTALEGNAKFDTMCEKNSPVRYYADGGIGKYNVSVSGFEVKPNVNGAVNYTIVYQSGTIKVLPREVKLIAQPHEKIYGDTDPKPSYIIEGGVILTSELENLVLTRETGEDVGKYKYLFDYTQLKGSDKNNYTITYVPDYLTIIPAELVITANDESRPLKTPNPPFSVKYAGFKFADTPVSLEGKLQFKCDANYSSPIGEYPITPYGLSSKNYAIVYKDGALTIYDGADIEISKAADREAVLMGESILYSIAVKNTGERELADVLINDVITGISGKIEAVPSDEYEYIGNGQFKIKALAMGQTVTIKYTYKALNTDMGGSIIKNIATATVPDSEYSWTTDEVEVLIDTKRDISFDKSTNVGFAQAGQTVKYSLAVTNTGNVPLEGIKVEDKMTPHDSVLNVVPSKDYTVWKDKDSEHRVFTLRTIQPGETIVIEYTLKISAADDKKEMAIQNFAVATVPSDGGYPQIVKKDEAIIFTGMTEQPLMVKTADKTLATVGDTITYTIVYTNNTGKAIPQIVVQDKQVPKRDRAEILPGDGYSVNSKNNQITLDALKPGESVTIKIQYVVQLQDTKGHDEIYDFIQHNGNMGVLSNKCYVAIK